ncbi:MAG: DinB family protein [Acidobacteriota bacterium]|nr:DinB family protein [Acidobacteriota bacterium]
MAKKDFVAVLGLVILIPTLAQAQVVSSLARLHEITAEPIKATADLVSEDLYRFRPADDVRTLGQILAHIANFNYAWCSIAAGTDNPSSENFEETRTTKAAITQALEGALAYCQGVYRRMTDEQGAEAVQFLGDPDFARSAVLASNSAHNFEHYGNLVTYMRINGIMPPSSR